MKVWKFLLAGAVLTFALTYYGASLKKHKSFDYLKYDAEGYYNYLPGAFIYGDFQELKPNDRWQRNYDPETGRLLIKYQYGVALFEAPFVLAAYAIHAANGHELRPHVQPIYGRAVLLAACFYLSAALILLWLILLDFGYSQRISTLTVACILLSTNLLYYGVREPGMSHAYTFFSVCLFFYGSLRLRERPSWKNILITGVSAGLILSIRLVNGYLLFFPLLMGMVHGRGVLGELQRWWQYRWAVLAAIAIGMLILFPQFLYWKHVTGSWLMYSYTDEGFDHWQHSQMGKVLTGPRNGWLTYSPFWLLLFPGLLVLWRQRNTTALPVTVIWFFAWYLFGSWWCYWFGGAMGHRAFIDLYPYLALPVAAVFTWAFQRRWSRIALFVFLAFATTIALVLMRYYTIDFSESYWTWEKYWAWWLHRISEL